MRVALAQTLVTLLVSGAFATAHPQRAAGAVAAPDLDLGDIIQPQQLSDAAAAFQLADTDASDTDATAVLGAADATAAPIATAEGDRGSQTSPEAQSSQHCRCVDVNGSSIAVEGLHSEEIREALAGASHGRKLSQVVDLAALEQEILFINTQIAVFQNAIAGYEGQLTALAELANAGYVTSLAFSPGGAANPFGRRLLSTNKLVQANLKEARKLRGSPSKPGSSTA